MICVQRVFNLSRIVNSTNVVADLISGIDGQFYNYRLYTERRATSETSIQFVLLSF